MRLLSDKFIDGYRDGHGQAVQNVRYNIIEYLEKYGSISIDIVNEICDACEEIDEEYLNQEG